MTQELTTTKRGKTKMSNIKIQKVNTDSKTCKVISVSGKEIDGTVEITIGDNGWVSIVRRQNNRANYTTIYNSWYTKVMMFDGGKVKRCRKIKA